MVLLRVIPEVDDNNSNNDIDDSDSGGDDDDGDDGDDDNNKLWMYQAYIFRTSSLLSPRLCHLKIECLSAIQKDLDVDTITFNILNVTYSDDDHITKNSIGQHNKVKYNTEYHIII